ncbi:hypothetical protein NDU88_006199 [Pleurodeles waltl]|uniref:Uncharacterized protein n=1 Tax=Pleurodeles waltl TaxID=8319 RepID=A0AAV7X0I2_PLEWA|nr:hypothetical protein NDU88_006199 [Pleurodeles waltl]
MSVSVIPWDLHLRGIPRHLRLPHHEGQHCGVKSRSSNKWYLLYLVHSSVRSQPRAPMLCASFFSALLPRRNHQARGRPCLSGQLPPADRALGCVAHKALQYSRGVSVLADSPGRILSPPPAGAARSQTTPVPCRAALVSTLHSASGRRAPALT